jgi:polyisoprenoid-binding protein YceI
MRKLWRQAFIGMLVSTLVMAPEAALAMGWTIAPEQSWVQFEYQRNGQPAKGRFSAFAGEGVFDPDAPADATLELRIESASIDLEDAMASAFATSAEWFDSANHPQVVYRLTKLTPEGANSYHATGELTIRGKTRSIESTITLDIGEVGNGDGRGEARASGSLVMDRKDYLLGVGPSALFVKIGREVAVRFELTAHPQH